MLLASVSWIRGFYMSQIEKPTVSPSLVGFLGRFTVVHVVTYFAIELVFATLLVYPEYFASVYGDLLRPFDDPLVMAAPILQLIRGPVLALPFFLFRRVILEGRWGWLKLFFALWILTAIASIVPAFYNIEGIIYLKAIPLQLRLVTLPSITLQMLTFSWLFYTWERRREKKIAIPLVAALIVIVALLLMGLLVTISP